jgi:hypothetical protein
MKLKLLLSACSLLSSVILPHALEIGIQKSQNSAFDSLVTKQDSLLSLLDGQVRYNFHDQVQFNREFDFSNDSKIDDLCFGNENCAKAVFLEQEIFNSY